MDDIFILGAGAMAESFIKGVVAQQAVDPARIRVLNRTNRDRLVQLQEMYGISPAGSLAEVRRASVVILSIKPYDVLAACKNMADYLSGQTLISFAAGISIAAIQSASGGKAQVVRTMPNVPVAVMAGAIALAAAPDVSAKGLDEAVHLLSQLGEVVVMEEAMIDAATAVSGSGPGFLSYLLEAMEQAAVELGFTPELARRLIIQTVIGTAHVLREWELSPAELRKRVTSPNGTTHAGLTVLAGRGVQQAIVDAMRQAAMRAEEMGLEYTRQE
ncbi:pyrroline-5-carboxylate reductase [Alicyclobacillus hesperidum URH17-3-68]|uniref:pyrroline-5-carboxylate reductase n=1 Tax=Alicyclobacillus hesperidum TaxID=89784 RepID=UPI000281C313|nr:pyrroline-5-carboxylate reductase [Alicyclobacillus hesperidum]EJY54928.1 pyrroline-5-carboxylate reductase [Alicyclobacillus hesperidum URH17-3-68]